MKVHTLYSLATATLLAGLCFSSVVSAEPCGRWEVVPSPAPEDGSNLWGVDEIARDDAWAVGHFDDKYDPFSADQFSLALHWDGSTWSRVPSPSPGVYLGGGTDVFLYDVEMVGPREVWAAGTKKTQHSIDGFIGFQYFVLHWDGSEWTEVDAPETPVGGTGARIYGIDSNASDDIWAVGSRVYPEVVGTDEVATALHWAGNEWREFVMPIVNEHQRLQRVRAFSPDDVWAAGGHGIEPADQVYVTRWDGTSWQRVSGIPEPGLQNMMFDIDGVSADDLWIVGEINEGFGGTRPLLFHYDGESWTEFDVPGFQGFQGRVEAVTAVASDDVWASGTYTAPDQVARPLLLHWDGSEWMQVPSATDGPEFGWFQSMISTGGCDAWSVGQSSGVTHIQRLVPDDLTRAELTEIVALRGVFVDGDIDSLARSDDERLRTAAVEVAPRQLAGVEIIATSPLQEVGRLDLSIEWSLGDTDSAVGAFVRILEPRSGAWTQLDAERLPREDTEHRWAALSNPWRFVDSETGEIVIQVLSRTASSVPVGAEFELVIDQIKVEVGN